MDTDALFEGVDTSGSTRAELENSKRLYTYLLESIDAAIESDRPLDAVVDEGVLSGLIGAGLGATVMPAIMKAVCGDAPVAFGQNGLYLTAAVWGGGLLAGLIGGRPRRKKAAAHRRRTVDKRGKRSVT